MDSFTPDFKIISWIATKLADKGIQEVRALRTGDSPRVRWALIRAVRRGAKRATGEIYGNDRRSRRRAKRALLRGGKKYWPLVDRTRLHDLPYSLRRRVNECELPEPPGSETEIDLAHLIVSRWCSAILFEVESEATRRDGILGNLWLSFKADCIDSVSADTGGLGRTASDGTGQGRQPLADRVISVAPPFGKLNKRTQGRDEIIDGITASFGESSVHVLAGPGGSGKTRIALEIARNAQNAGRRVWWVPANRINSSMREVANQLGATESQIDQAWTGRGSQTDLAWRLLNAADEPWALVFDNADDPAVLDPSEAAISDGTGWLRRPVSAKGAVIVTSRNRNEGTWGPWSTVHEIGPLDSESGAHMLLDLTGDSAGTFEQARDLAAQLGGLPLALWAAANYLRSVNSGQVWTGSTGISDFESYRQCVREWAESPAGAPSDNSVDSLGLGTVQHAMNLSIELLTQRGQPQIARLLRTLACLGSSPIPYHELLDSSVIGASPLFASPTKAEIEAMLNALAYIGLIDLHELDRVSDPRLSHVLSLHPVFHGILRDDTEVHREREQYHRLIVDLVLNSLREANPDERDSWQRWYVLAPHAVETARATLLGGGPPDDSRLVHSAVELARLTCRWLIVSGLLKPAEDLAVPLIERCEAYGLGPTDARVLGLRHEYGRILLERGDAGAAEQELTLVIAERTRLLGEDHPDTLASRHKHARAILEQPGRWAEAEPLLDEIVKAESESEVRGPEHSDTMVVRHSLARAILFQGRAEEAEKMLRDILEVMHRHWPPDNPQTLFVRHSLVVALNEQEEWDKAEAEVAGALSVAAERPESPHYLALRHQRGMVLLGRGQVDEAKRYLAELLRDETRVLGSTHPTTELTTSLLAKLRDEIQEK